MPESDPFQLRWRLVQAANALPLNQEAKRWLDLAQAPANQSDLYLLQLILWGLDTDGGHLLTEAPARREVMEDIIHQLMGKYPALALKFITLTDDPEDEDSNLTSSHLEDQEDTANAAWAAVDALDGALMEHLDYYPPKECRELPTSRSLEPPSENDETPDDDSSENVDIERFGFLQEDREIIQELIAGVRRALKRKSITPQQICGLGKLLYGLERLPRSTSGMEIDVTIGNSTPDYFSYQSINLSESSFELMSGGSQYTPGVGSDTYTTFSFRVEVGGYRDDTEVTEVEDWTSGFIESLCDEDQVFKVDDQDEGAVMDWDEKVPGNDWDLLDSAY